MDGQFFFQFFSLFSRLFFPRFFNVRNPRDFRPNHIPKGKACTYNTCRLFRPQFTMLSRFCLLDTKRKTRKKKIKRKKRTNHQKHHNHQKYKEKKKKKKMVARIYIQGVGGGWGSRKRSSACTPTNGTTTTSKQTLWGAFFKLRAGTQTNSKASSYTVGVDETSPPLFLPSRPVVRAPQVQKDWRENSRRQYRVRKLTGAPRPGSAKELGLELSCAR